MSQSRLIARQVIDVCLSVPFRLAIYLKAGGSERERRMASLMTNIVRRPFDSNCPDGCVRVFHVLTVGEKNWM